MDSHSEPILLAWIRKTVKYLSYSFNRQNAHRPPTVELGEWIASEGTQPTEPPPTTADSLTQDEQLYDAYLALIRPKLSPGQLQLFECIIVEHHSISSAAKLLHMKENTVKIGLKRLRAKLKREILPQILQQ